MDLLERDGALAELAGARQAATAGRGSVVLVTGEAGIGKTALITRFAAGLQGEARVLLGVSDDLTIPRPLGPLRYLSGPVSAALREALTASAPPSEVHARLLEELQRAPSPTVLVLEDVHWADDATLDAVMVVARRAAALPAVLVLSYRDAELNPDHPMRAVLGAIPADAIRHVPLAPLSRQAVGSLAGDDADRVFEVTGGNPFYVTELLAARPAELPASVANAVLGRASRLDSASRQLVELVAMVPTRIEIAVLAAVLPGWEAAAEEPEHRQLLELGAGHVRFRHELARTAIRSSVPMARRRRLHAEILRVLLARSADPAEIVHHAEAAGDAGAVADHALVAARQAAAMSSNREAHAHYRRAIDFAARYPESVQAALFEEQAVIAYLVNRLDDAFSAIRRAIEANRARGDLAAVGRCTRVLSRLHWYAGDGEAAWRAGHSAVEILEPLGESVELARAYGGLGQLAMLSGRIEETADWSDRAVRLAERLGHEPTRVHALINVGVARGTVDPDDQDLLLEAHRAADAVGDHHEAVRALIGIGGNLTEWVRPGEARPHVERAIAYAREHQVDTLLSYLLAMSAWLHLRAGAWPAAERLATAEIEKGATVAQILAKIVLAELAVRRGDPDAARRLADLAEQADATRELQHIEPVVELEVEWALLTDGPMPVDRIEGAVELIGPTDRLIGWEGARLAAWAAVAGTPVRLDVRMPRPHAAMARRDWAGAADAFGAVGWSYDRALFLSLLDDEPALAEALEIARNLGAAPLARRIARRMREAGLRVPRGPRGSTRANPLGLTDRQFEVLRLLADGLSNAEIADRLVVSPRTAEHHVAAVLAKLDAATRRDAARRAAELGLTGG